MFNQLLRYYPVIKIIDAISPNKILEVGSGSQGLGQYIHKRFVGVDANFEDYLNVPQSISPNLQAVRANGSYLPFQNNTFDLVICIDTLEHVPMCSRERLIVELVRVARGKIFLSFPSGDRALAVDERLHEFYKREKIEVPGWLIEHLHYEYPTFEYIQDILKRNLLRFQTIKNENTYLHYLIMRTEIGKLGKILTLISKVIARSFSYNANGKIFTMVHYFLKASIIFILQFFTFKNSYRTIFIIEK